MLFSAIKRSSVLILSLLILSALSSAFYADGDLLSETGVYSVYRERLTEEISSLSLCEGISAVTVKPSEYPSLALQAKAAILMEPSSGTVLFAMNEDERLNIASVTKIMTLLLIMEAIEDGTLAYGDVVTVSEYAAGMGGSQIWLEVGEKMTVDDLLKSIAVGSANDSCVAMAEHLAGSEEEFVRRMNERAASLGMENTCFVNCNGLDVEGHYSSARDVALMTAELLKYRDILKYTTIWMDTLRGGELSLVNTNKMLRTYSGMTGMKTGYTSEAGYCLSGTALRDGMELIAVTLGEPSVAQRSADTKKMLDFGYSTYAFKRFAERDISPVTVLKGSKTSVPVGQDNTFSVLVKKGDDARITEEVLLHESIPAPVSSGQKVGEIVYTLDGEEIGRVPIVALETVKRLGFVEYLRDLIVGMI